MSKEFKYDLVVAYRIYPGISKVPPVYPRNKLKLARFCLESFKKSLTGLKVKVYALLDNCSPEYEALFREYFDVADLEVVKLSGIGNKKTFEKQIEILSNQNDSDIVYFAEDDYFYIKDLKNALDFIKSGEAGFVTPYEHPSCYTDGHVISNVEQVFQGQKYITVQHACLTFMTTKKNLIENKKMFSIYPHYFASDFVVWGCITLGNTFFRYVKLLKSVKNFSVINVKVYGSMWFFAWYRFLRNKRYKLYMPVNTIGVHLESNFLSPGIDWNGYFKDKQE